MPVPAMTISERTARFWASVDQSAGLDKCWPWTAGMTAGYGAFGWPLDGRYKIHKAHRLAFYLAFGFLPRREERLVIRHMCGNAACCNPRHLRTGTKAQNSKDMVDHGRAGRKARAYGRAHNAALSDPTVAAIKAALEAGATQLGVAKRTGLSLDTIHDIAHGRSYRSEPAG